MDLFLGLFLILVVVPALVWFFWNQRRQMREKYSREQAEIDRQYRESIRKHEAMRKRLGKYHAQQYRRFLRLASKLGVLYPTARNPVTSDWDQLDRELAAPVGPTLYEILEAAPEPEDCAHLTPDEFEATIRRRLAHKYEVANDTEHGSRNRTRTYGT